MTVSLRTKMLCTTEERSLANQGPTGATELRGLTATRRGRFNATSTKIYEIKQAAILNSVFRDVDNYGGVALLVNC